MVVMNRRAVLTRQQQIPHRSAKVTTVLHCQPIAVRQNFIDAVNTPSHSKIQSWFRFESFIALINFHFS